MNRSARRLMAKCKHDLQTKTDGRGEPWLTVCARGCGYEEWPQEKPSASEK